MIYPDWHASVRRQGEQLAALIEAHWPGRSRVLDVACGIGTQSIGLALQGYGVTGSDLSPLATERARLEANAWDVSISFSVCDMRGAHTAHASEFEVVICCDNSLPHLLCDDDIAAALSEMRRCLCGGGGCLISVRDYDQEPRGRHLLKPYGLRVQGDMRYVIFQIWDFQGDCYDLSMVFVAQSLSNHAVTTQVMRSRYYAVGINRLSELLRQAGFSDVRRIDGGFHQPILVGTKA